MEVIRYYKKYVVENKSIVFISIILALFFRLSIYFFYAGATGYPNIGGYLWTESIQNYLAANKDVSALLALLFTIIIVLYSAYLNNKHKLIRSRTYMIYAFSTLLFSIHPATMYMSPQYVSLLLLLVGVDIFLGGYQQADPSGKAYSFGFLIALAGLFSLGAIVYLPLFWIGLRMMRCLKAKAVITSLLGVVSVYWIVFFYYIWQNDLSSFWEPFTRLYPAFDGYIIANIDFSSILILAYCIVLVGITMVSYLNNSYQDKIQARANLYFFYMLTVFSFLIFIFINYDPTLYLYVFLSGSSILFSHFFSLNIEKWKVTFFYLSVILCVMAGVYFLVSKTIIGLLAV